MSDTKRIDCEDVQKFICMHFGEDVSSDRCRAVRDHLAHCANCTQYCDSIDAMIALYRAASPTFPEAAKTELLQALGIRK